MNAKTKFEALKIISELPVGDHNFFMSSHEFYLFRDAAAIYNTQFKAQTDNKTVVPISILRDATRIPQTDVTVKVREHERFNVRNPLNDPLSIMKGEIASLIPGNSVRFNNPTPEMIQSIRVFCSKREKGGYMVSVGGNECVVYRHETTKENYSAIVIEKAEKLSMGECFDIQPDKAAYTRLVLVKHFDRMVYKFRFERYYDKIVVRRVPPKGQ